MTENRLSRGLGMVQVLLTLALVFWVGCSRTTVAHQTTPSTENLPAASPEPNAQESEQAAAPEQQAQPEPNADPYETLCGPRAPRPEPVDCVFRRGIEAYGVEDYQTAATTLLNAVDIAPDHDAAAESLLTAANALERLGRLDSSGHVLQRIIDQVGPRVETDPTHQAQLDSVVAHAYFMLGFRATERTAYEEALRYFRPLADSRRLALSNNDSVQMYRADATMNVAQIFEQLQRFAEAIRYYQRIVADDASGESNRQHAADRLSRLLP